MTFQRIDQTVELLSLTYQRARNVIVTQLRLVSGKRATLEPLRMPTGGKLGKAQGFSPLQLLDAQSIFERSPDFLWEAQQENKRPYVEDISIPEFSKERHGIKSYKPLPENGRIYNAIDFGGRHPFGISYFQVLDHNVYVLNHARVEVLIQKH